MHICIHQLCDDKCHYWSTHRALSNSHHTYQVHNDWHTQDLSIQEDIHNDHFLDYIFHHFGIDMLNHNFHHEFHLDIVLRIYQSKKKWLGLKNKPKFVSKLTMVPSILLYKYILHLQNCILRSSHIYILLNNFVHIYLQGIFLHIYHPWNLLSNDMFHQMDHKCYCYNHIYLSTLYPIGVEDKL